jgi:histidinol-phosphate aminotransferase
MGIALARLRDVDLYKPDRAPCAIDLSDNTNLWGPAPSAARAVAAAASAGSRTLTRYPSVYADALRESLAGYIGVDASHITTGCGSDDVLDSAIRAFAEPGDTLVLPDPTFHMIPLFARVNGLRIVRCALTPDYDVDVDATLAAAGGRARITYLCSPNNPTGVPFSRDRIERIARDAKGLVILDEAYVEYADWSAIDLLQHTDCLIITRTLSKAFGLAGLRIGYAVGAPTLINEIAKARGPYKINALADVAARAALANDLVWVRNVVDQVRDNRARLACELEKLGLASLPSASNFVLVRVPSDPGALTKALRERGVAVRAFPQVPRFGDAIRITVGPWDFMQRCLDALAACV